MAYCPWSKQKNPSQSEITEICFIVKQKFPMFWQLRLVLLAGLSASLKIFISELPGFCPFKLNSNDEGEGAGEMLSTSSPALEQNSVAWIHMTRKRDFHSLAKFLVNHLLVTEPKSAFWSMGSSTALVMNAAPSPLLKGNGLTVSILRTSLQRNGLEYPRLKNSSWRMNWNTHATEKSNVILKMISEMVVVVARINSDVLPTTQANWLHRTYSLPFPWKFLHRYFNAASSWCLLHFDIFTVEIQTRLPCSCAICSFSCPTLPSFSLLAVIPFRIRTT